MLVTSMFQLFDCALSTDNFSWLSALRDKSTCARGAGRNELAQAIRTLVCTYVLARLPLGITVKSQPVSTESLRGFPRH
jgi:hypothetical protein